MEWIVPVLFVLATVAQWWLKRHHGAEESSVPPPIRKGSPSPTTPEPDPFEDLGDLLEALGRRRHESPPPPVIHAPNPTPVGVPNSATMPELTPLAPMAIVPAPSPVASAPMATTPKARHRPFTRESQPRIRSRLREAVVLSEILAPPLALR